MRGLWYSVVNMVTMEKTFVGLDSFKANEKLAEMRKADLQGEYKLVYKWANL